MIIFTGPKIGSRSYTEIGVSPLVDHV